MKRTFRRHLKWYARLRKSGYFPCLSPGEVGLKAYVSKRDILWRPPGEELWWCMTGCKQAYIDIANRKVEFFYEPITIWR